MMLNPQDELLERARKVIRELREKLSAAEARSQSEPVAIIGIGIRFPGCGSDQEQFWRMIVEGRDAVRNIPADRWDRDAFHASESPTPGKMNTLKGAFLHDVRRFDAAFFDITPREATGMDPQQRIFLETAWHALEDAGLPKARIANTDTGVFVGVHNHSADYSALQFGDLAKLDAYSATGTAHDMIAGRLAYWLDLHGPAVTVNTACSSSLTAVHFACRSLRAGDCTTAIAGGVNLLLAPGTTVAAAQLQLLSADGRCKTFDARADGMGRGEGCGVVVLKRLDAAVRDDDRVLAIIRGSAVNQDGRTNGMTAPNGLAQERLLRSALKDAGVEPSEIGYVEAHGTGTALGDPIEVEALAAVLGGERREQSCTLGAVKANISHLEGAAGIAGLIKAVLVLRHRWLPPVANLETLNPHLPSGSAGLKIPRHGCEWTTTSRRLAGVSSFGWSGTNVHVVLEEASSPVTAEMKLGEWPVLVSAQSPETLQILAMAYADRLEDASGAELANISYTSAVRRTHHAYRMAVKGSDPKAIAARLRERATSPKAQMRSGQMANSEPQFSDKQILVWETGNEVDWTKTFPVPLSVVDLPSYPFQGKPYWLNESSASSATTASFPQEWLYSTDWVERPLDRSQADAPLHPMTWLLFHGDPSGEKLAHVIRQRGHRVIEVRRGDCFARESKDAFVLGEQVSEGIQQLLGELTLDGIHPHRVVYCAGREDAAALTADALELAKSIILSGISTKLSFITQSAELIARSAPGSRDQAGLRGFSRVLGLEHPEAVGGIIDVDSFCKENVNAAFEEIAFGSSEDRVALRHGSRWVPRLHRDHAAPKPEPLKLKAERCYLVTGAFGRLGMEIASWLVDCGARHLALVGRRAPSEMGNPGLIEQLEAWRSQGISVMAEACDVAQESQVRELLAQIEQSGRALAGVVHAAAGVRFRPVAEATRQDVEFAFHAKVDGAQVLDRCTRESELDFFVLFGSAAATIGLRNGALYAAANSSLDVIRAQRQSKGLPVLLVEWGSWEARDPDKQQDLVGRSGFRAMPTARAFLALGAMIASGRTTGLLADIDWAVLGPALEMRGKQALIEDLVDETATVTKAINDSQETAWLDGLRNLPAQERRDCLLDFVGDAVRKIFGMTGQDLLDEDRGLFAMGMDSLMSVRLKRRLEAGTGLRLPGTLTLTYPTISALAQFLEEKLFPGEAQTKAEPMDLGKRENDGLASVAQMNDSDIDAAIAAELAVIQQKFGAL